METNCRGKMVERITEELKERRRNEEKHK